MDGAALETRRMAPGASRWGTRSTIEAIGATTPSALVAVPGGFAVGYTVRDAVAGSPSAPRVSLIRPQRTTKLDVAAASAGVRDVRLAWSHRHGLLATMVMDPAVGGNPGLGVGAFLAPDATGSTPSPRSITVAGASAHPCAGTSTTEEPFTHAPHALPCPRRARAHTSRRDGPGRHAARRRIVERPDLQSHFKARGTIGTMVVTQTGRPWRTVVVGSPRSRTRYLPSSTFKIPN